MKNEEISELTKSNYSFDKFNKIQYIRGKAENALIREKVNQIVNTNVDYKYEEVSLAFKLRNNTQITVHWRGSSSDGISSHNCLFQSSRRE